MKLMSAIALPLVVAFALNPAMADDNPLKRGAVTEVEDEGGTLNPDEMSLSKSLKNAMRGQVDMVICAQGYLMTKMGEHGDARTIFRNCADKGYTGTMTWMSYMETNGFGAKHNPQAAAEWDRRAAEAGDPIGHLNHGLNLLRGHGVERDEITARKFIDKAADAGVKDAIEVRGSGYDWNAATPDADNWRYEERVF
ncbi:MAG: sel1 repeat family protein [Ahrensia sp.]|nr:sel1 repeat family protein [Ahrensia sp.]